MKFLFKICATIAMICIVMFTLNYFIKEKIYIKPYNEFVKDISQEYNIEENLIYAIIKVESKFKEDATSSAQAKGLMQVVDSTAQEMSEKIGMINFEPNMLYQPQVNIEIGTKYFSTLVNKYDDVILALIAYNAGQGNLDKWMRNGQVTDVASYYNLPYSETTAYWQKVMREYNAYNKIYEEK